MPKLSLIHSWNESYKPNSIIYSFGSKLKMKMKREKQRSYVTVDYNRVNTIYHIYSNLLLNIKIISLIPFTNTSDERKKQNMKNSLLFVVALALLVVWLFSSSIVFLVVHLLSLSFSLSLAVILTDLSYSRFSCFLTISK